jgi:protein ImuA
MWHPKPPRFCIEGVWHADTLANAARECLSTGHAPLDAVLPGGGWPSAQLTELLQGTVNHSEWWLLAPLLQQLDATAQIALVAPPLVPHTPALSAHGIRTEQLWWVQASTWQQRLWATEQLLRCDAIGAVLVWLPQATPNGLRRLQMAAQTPRSNGLRPPWLFAMRPWAAAADISPAPLRIHIKTHGQAGLRLQLIKRQGPPLARTVNWPLPPALASILPAQPTTPHVLDRPDPCLPTQQHPLDWVGI